MTLSKPNIKRERKTSARKLVCRRAAENCDSGQQTEFDVIPEAAFCSVFNQHLHINPNELTHFATCEQDA